MCTIALATRLIDDWPVLIGANRDERYDRPASPPRLVETDPWMYAPIDEEAGGTWIGVNAAGLVVAIANRRDGPAGQRSRGLLVRDVLRTGSAEDGAAVATASIDQHRYAGCTLLLVDPTAARVLDWDGGLRDRELAPGMHVLVNHGIDGEVPKSAVARARLQAPSIDSVAAWHDRLPRILGDHGVNACWHGDTFGTRSASSIDVHRNGRIRYAYAVGPPCSEPFELYLDDRLPNR